MTRTCLLSLLLFVSFFAHAQQKTYPKGYFRNPLNISMELVANFGELRTNHWHMGLDIRTQQRENLPVHAAAEGYIARVKIEPGGFGRAIYINHPNGYTTLYAHLNAFMPALESWVKEQQYQLQSWAVELIVPPHLFPLRKGEFFAYSGNTGGSAGPHVHFEIRDTKTDNCLNPLLFGFPVADAVPPTLVRLAMYDRTRSVYIQSPQLMALKKTGARYSLAASNLLKVGSNKVSFALGAVDRLSGSANPNGIYSSRLYLDDELQSEFVLDDISYTETRYLNAQIDYRYKYNGGSWLQHLSCMPGDISGVYTSTPSEGIIHLNDEAVHTVRIEVEDAAHNVSVLQFTIQYNEALYNEPVYPALPVLIPNFVNVFEKDGFELFTTEHGVYDTVYASYAVTPVSSAIAASGVHSFIGPSVPVHDSVIVRIRIKPDVPPQLRDKVVIQGISGTRKVVQKANWNGDWAWAKFRQLGTFQALIDNDPPTLNAPATDLSRNKRMVFTPVDNLKDIKSFRAELDGQWLRFTNNGDRTWIYTLDEKVTPGEHELKVRVEDEAGNTTTRVWTVRR